jgi:predicted RNase H-like HicB family nuclease
MSRLTVEMIPDVELGGFTVRVPDIRAYGEGATEEEAIADLKEALRGYVEAFGIEDALARANAGNHKVGRCAETSYMSFLRHREIFPSDGGASPAASTTCGAKRKQL